jgi:HupE / UreJ protein
VRQLVAIAAMVAALTMGLLSSVSAHKSSDSYLSLRVNGQEIYGQWDVALRDLDYAIGLDSNNDGMITWGELRSLQTPIASYLLSRLTLQMGDKACTTRVIEHLVDDHSDGAYEVLRFAADCAGPPQPIQISYNFFFDLDPQHRGLLRLEANGQIHTAVFSPNHKTWRLEGGSVSWTRTFLDYFNEGVWHIWTGFDHILFLCALLLPAVLSHSSGRWKAVPEFGEAFRNVLKIVTAFTLAHSITLSLAVLGFISLPSRLVESAIALSVIAAALNNLHPVIEGRLWMVAFGFGLVHGLGFANVLTELGLPAGALAVALVSFNLGVEAGQLVIVCTILPVAYLLRSSWVYPRLILGAGSLSIAAIAFVWLIERSLNLSLLS